MRLGLRMLLVALAMLSTAAGQGILMSSTSKSEAGTAALVSSSDKQTPTSASASVFKDDTAPLPSIDLLSAASAADSSGTPSVIESSSLPESSGAALVHSQSAEGETDVVMLPATESTPTSERSSSSMDVVLSLSPILDDDSTFEDLIRPLLRFPDSSSSTNDTSSWPDSVSAGRRMRPTASSLKTVLASALVLALM